MTEKTKILIADLIEAEMKLNAEQQNYLLGYAQGIVAARTEKEGAEQ